MDKLVDKAQDFLWRSWTTLGVRGAVPPIEHLLLDPEGLILLTSLGGTDARLREEATDWCARYFGFVSITRLKNLANRLPEVDRARLHAFAGGVNAVSSAKWPTAGGVAHRIKLSGKSRLPPLSRAALAQLRYRAIFGTTARAEALLYLGRAQGWSSAAEVAEGCGHKKRIMAKTLDELVVGGVVTTRGRGNRSDFRVLEKKKLDAFAGPVEPRELAWLGWARVLSSYLHLEGRKPTVRRIELARVLEESSLDGLAEPTDQSVYAAFRDATGT